MIFPSTQLETDPGMGSAAMDRFRYDFRIERLEFLYGTEDLEEDILLVV